MFKYICKDSITKFVMKLTNMKVSRSNNIVPMILWFLPLIEGQASSRNVTCCDTTTCLQEKMQQNLIRLGQTRPGPNQVSLNPLIYDPAMIYHVHVPDINVNITLSNNELQGMSGGVVSDVRWSFSGNNTVISYINTFPNMIHTANYTATGTIRDPSGSSRNDEISIDETGLFTAQFPHLVITHTVNLTTVKRDGENVWRVLNATMTGSFKSGNVDFIRRHNNEDESRRNTLLMINRDLQQIIENIRPEINQNFDNLYIDFSRSNLEGRPANALICQKSHGE